jgi:hypothetical protein
VTAGDAHQRRHHHAEHQTVRHGDAEDAVGGIGKVLAGYRTGSDEDQGEGPKQLGERAAKQRRHSGFSV